MVWTGTCVHVHVGGCDNKVAVVVALTSTLSHNKVAVVV